jgi:hypothetical protein
MNIIVNIKNIKKCAFCEHWYDPTNSARAPKSSAVGLWKIKDINQKCLCYKKNINMSANAFCSQDEYPDV